MLSLGLGGSNHDFAACLVEDGAIRYAVEEERLARVKYAVGVNSMFAEGWRYCLDANGSELASVGSVVADDALLPSAYFKFRSRTHLIRHHVSHAASAFFPSPFERSAIIVVDGAGSLVDGHGVETLTTAVGEGTAIEEIGKVYGTNYTTDGLSAHRIYQAGDSDNSLGFMYKSVSKAIGFALYEEGDWYLTEDGKTMGLAPYGDDRYYEDFRKHLELLDDGGFALRLRDGGLLDFVGSALEPFSGHERFARGADLAWAAQAILEETLVHVARHLYDVAGSPNLCLAGGVALNCVANGKVLRETPFEDVYVQPAAGDAGCAAGAALYGYHVLQGGPRQLDPGSRSWTRHAYYGRTYAPDDVDDAVQRSGLAHVPLEDAAKTAAELLAQGLLLAWFTGGSEFGPRALGHRSILADPRDPTTKDTLNRRVKHREDFRPFAPAVLLEHAPEYFDLAIESPFMLIVAPVHPDRQDAIPAVVHVDGTARVQTLTEANGRFRDLVAHFHELTGVPVVLNTSLNDRGQPIVERPEEALEFFASSELDYLVMEDHLVAHDRDGLRRAGFDIP